MLFKNIKIGDRIELTLAKDSKSKAYVSQVYDITGDNELLVRTPISNGQLLILSVKLKYNAVFITEKGIVIFPAAITGYHSEGVMHLMKLKLKGEGMRVQRREFFRFECLLPMLYAVLEDETAVAVKFKDLEVQIEDGIIRDIGGGGIRFASNSKHEENQFVRCSIRVMNDQIEAAGKILVRQYFPNLKFKYQYRVQFTDISDEDRELIVNYIYLEQRKALMKNRAR